MAGTENGSAGNAVDGNPDTIWVTRWGADAPGFPHSLTVEFRRTAALKGCSLLPRQGPVLNGGIKSYEIYASTDGRDWGEPIVKGEFAPGPDLKLVAFPRPVTAKFLKLVALSGLDAQPFAALAEFEVER
jgi:beta-galactosidase